MLPLHEDQTRHKTSVLCQGVCYPLTPDNSMVDFPTLQGGFVSPMRAALYARVSTHDQQTLAMQRDALHEFATHRGWTVIATVEEIASGAKDRRPQRQTDHLLLGGHLECSRSC